MLPWAGAPSPLPLPLAALAGEGEVEAIVNWSNPFGLDFRLFCSEVRVLFFVAAAFSECFVFTQSGTLLGLSAISQSSIAHPLLRAQRVGEGGVRAFGELEQPLA